MRDFRIAHAIGSASDLGRACRCPCGRPELANEPLSAHLFVVHFPIALLLVGALADALGVAAGRTTLRRHATGLLILGAAFALLAFFTGQGAIGPALVRISPGSTALETHAQWGAVGVWLLAGAGALRALWRERLEGMYGWICLALAIASAALVTIITVTGTAIAHGS
jgi:uncharacterized membrane protein